MERFHGRRKVLNGTIDASKEPSFLRAYQSLLYQSLLPTHLITIWSPTQSGLKAD